MARNAGFRYAGARPEAGLPPRPGRQRAGAAIKMESSMSKYGKIIMALALVALAAACAKKEEVVYVEEPVTVEPTYTGKYK
jgi:hypothetical protein